MMGDKNGMGLDVWSGGKDLLREYVDDDYMAGVVRLCLRYGTHRAMKASRDVERPNVDTCFELLQGMCACSNSRAI